MTDTPRTVSDLMAEIELLTIEIQRIYLQGNPIVIGWSGGKYGKATKTLSDRSDYTRKIFREYLDKVRCMIHTIEG